MENKFTDEMLESQISKNTKEAEELLKDEDRMERFLERLERKLEKVPVVGKQLSNIPMLVSLVRSYIRKDYRDVPLGSIIAIVSALIYFLSPIVDDAAVFAFVWKMVADDIEEYRKWQEANGKRIFKD